MANVCDRHKATLFHSACPIRSTAGKERSGEKNKIRNNKKEGPALKKGCRSFLFVKKEWRILYSAQFALSLQIESLRKLNKNL
jgi:hypothetical protein